MKKLKRWVGNAIDRSAKLKQLKLQWDFSRRIRPTLRKQLRFTGNALGSKSEKKKRVLMPQVETSHYQFYHMLALAKALEMRGAEVKFLVCGSRLDGCEIKSIKNLDSTDPCVSCRFNHQNAVPMFKVDLLQLPDLVSDSQVQEIETIAARVAENYPSRFEYKGLDIISTVNDSVIRFFYGAVPNDPVLLAKIRKQHLVTTMIGIEAAQVIDRDFSPNVIFNNMLVYSMIEPYFKYFSAKPGVHLASVSITPDNYHSVLVNIRDHFISRERFKKYLRYRKNRHLDEREKSVLEGFIKTRVKGNTAVYKDAKFFAPNPQLVENLKINKKHRNVFLFPNIFWDLATAEKGAVFDGVIDWVLSTIEMAKDRPDIHLFVKPHPAEKFNSAPSMKGVVDFIAERFPTLPANLTLITPEMRVKPYDLFPYIDLGVVYSGTLGLEMMLAEIPVVVTGKAPYSDLSFANEPTTLEEYRQAILGDGPLHLAPRQDVEVFGYYYFIKNFVPWNITQRAFGDDFKSFAFDTLDDLVPGKNKYLDHLCDCILNPEETVIESWE